jgi:hypothetical protein
MAVAFFDHFVNPWHEQHVAQTRLDRTGAGEEMIRYGVPDRPQSELVTGFLFLKQGHDPSRTLAFGFIKIYPRENGH